MERAALYGQPFDVENIGFEPMTFPHAVRDALASWLSDQRSPFISDSM